jgi:hypothetical protein
MRIAEMLAQGLSALEIADALNAEGFRTGRGQKITVKRVQGDIMWLDAQWLLHAQRAIIGHKSAILQKVAWVQRFSAQSGDLKSFLAALKLEIDVTGAASPTIIGIEAVSDERVEEIRRSRWASASAALQAAGIEPDDDAQTEPTDAARSDASNTGK